MSVLSDLERYVVTDYIVDDNDYVTESPLAYKLELEMTAGVFTDVTSRVARASYSRHITTLFDPLVPDNAMFELHDSVGAFAPGRGSGIQPGRQARLTATYNNSYNLFYGRVTAVRNKPFIEGQQSTIIEAISDVDRLSSRTITTSLFQNIGASSLFTEIMSLSAVSSFRADALSETMEFAWYRDLNVVNALNQLVRSGNYYLYVDGAGTISLKRADWPFTPVGLYVLTDYVLEDYVSSIAVISDAFDLQYSLSHDRVLNDVKINAQPRQLATSVATIAQLAAPVSIPASGAIGFWLTYQDPLRGNESTPVGSFATQVASTDFYAAANSDGTGTNFTSTLSINMKQFGETAVASIFNGTGSTAWLTRFQLQGYPVRQSGLLGYQTEDSSSQNVFGRRAFELDNLIQDRSYIQSFATSIVTTRKNAQQDLTVALVNDYPQMLQREIGDLVAVINSTTGVNSSWVVFGMQHEIDLADGIRHQVTFNMRLY